MTTALAEREKFSPIGYTPGILTYEQWEQDGLMLQVVEAGRKWWIGDWVNFGEEKWGEKYAQALDVTGLPYELLANYANVARKCSFRNEKLSWTHHKHVAPLPPAEQQEWLDRAEEEGWSASELRSRIKATQKPPEAPEVGVRLNDGVFMRRPIRYEEDPEIDGLLVWGPEELLVGLMKVLRGAES